MSVLCIGKSMIQILARDGAWSSDDGRAAVAADDLCGADPYAEIERLRRELKMTVDDLDFVIASEKRLRAALEPFANAAEKARKEKGDPAYGLRWDDFLRAQNCFTNDEQALADREQE